MAHFKDLDDYSYLDEEGHITSKCIGWLEKGISYDTGDVSEEVLDRVWEYCQVSLMQSRGIHICELCDDEQGWTGKRNGVELRLGSAEIRVFGEDGTIYAAPDLIYHYMRDHHYRPPEAFLEALMRSPRPASPEHIQQIERYRFDWFLRGHNRKKIWAEPSVKKAIKNYEARKALWQEADHAVFKLNKSIFYDKKHGDKLIQHLAYLGVTHRSGALVQFKKKSGRKYQFTFIDLDGQVCKVQTDLDHPDETKRDDLTDPYRQAWEMEGGPDQDIGKAAAYARVLGQKIHHIKEGFLKTNQAFHNGEQEMPALVAVLADLGIKVPDGHLLKLVDLGNQRVKAIAARSPEDIREVTFSPEDPDGRVVEDVTGRYQQAYETRRHNGWDCFEALAILYLMKIESLRSQNIYHVGIY